MAIRNTSFLQPTFVSFLSAFSHIFQIYNDVIKQIFLNTQ